MKKTLAILLIALLAFSSGLIAYAAPDKNIVETAVDAPQFSTLVTAVVAAGLADTLSDEEAEFTVFAPTDDAFAALPDGILAKLLDNEEILAKVLLYHVVEGTVDSIAAAALHGEDVMTLAGQKISVIVDSDELFINGALVTTPDIFCTNGVIHEINAVLVPKFDIVETAIMNDGFETLVAAVVAADLVDTLKSDGPFTVFAPTDEAFAALPEGLLDELLADTDTLTKVLLYHVLGDAVFAETVLGLDGEEVETVLGQKVLITIDGENVFVNDSQVVVTDIECSNGVIHVIDAVLIPDLEEEADTDLPDTGLTPGAVYAGLVLAGLGIAISKKRK